MHIKVRYSTVITAFCYSKIAKRSTSSLQWLETKMLYQLLRCIWLRKAVAHSALDLLRTKTRIIYTRNVFCVIPNTTFLKNGNSLFRISLICGCVGHAFSTFFLEGGGHNLWILKPIESLNHFYCRKPLKLLELAHLEACHRCLNFNLDFPPFSMHAFILFSGS